KGAEGSPGGVVRSALTQHNEDLQAEILGLLLGLEDGARQPVDEAAVAIVERPERGAVLAEGAEQNLVRWVARGRLVISGPPQVGALATIVGRRGGWHTISTTPEPAGRMRGFVRREARGRWRAWGPRIGPRGRG